MLILTNGLTETADEGFLKVANSLVKRIKSKLGAEAFIVTYDREATISDRHLQLNKFLWNSELFSIIKKRRESVLYIPFPARPIANTARTFVLSLFAKYGLKIVWVQKSSLSFLSKCLLKMSGAKVIVLSAECAEYFEGIVGKERVERLKTGVDTEKFKPVSFEEAKALKEKYGFDPERPVVLHVGHMQSGRNIGELLKLDENLQILLVTSTLFKDDQDVELREKLLNAKNLRLIDYYLPNIEEIYQMSDVYFFPVTQSGHCIDVPLSCLEAAACNKPVVTTSYGEMAEFVGKDGFYFIESFDKNTVNSIVREALATERANTRASVLEYDWDNNLFIQ